MDWTKFDNKKQAALDITVAVTITVSCTECGNDIPNDFLGSPDKMRIHVKTPPCPECFPESHAKWKRRWAELNKD